MITEGIQHFVAIGKILKLAHEDCGRANPQLVVNWRELKPPSGGEVRTLIATLYKKIYNFVQLMQIYK